MTDPLTPEDPQPLHQAGGDAVQAEMLVQRVLSWYEARLTEARTGNREPEQLAAWRSGRDQAADDLDQLEDADEDETVQIALAYAARYKELTQA
ncbi:hypothetical protein RCO28_34665 [Streptomyces sp. LHD-70]|uniref:hypothetical protein n=1 Tax=Streptomyces sp. LHD-70 TaxID=3072140 RepID=UPI00280FF2BA|nr:hypothetical protein [Streptomyces sp. LHD-70]MDQ8707577.1 hypothetical protein [Streptomyces sp. LHD-70]